MTNRSEALLTELLAEDPADLRETEGRFKGGLTVPAFQLAARFAPRDCVDGVPVRRNKDGEIELMAIRRNTGKEIGKLCCVGGGVDMVQDKRFRDEKGDALWRPQSNLEALRKHFRTDLGWEIELVTGEDTPQYFAQDMKPDAQGKIMDGMMPNPHENVRAARYLVQITDGDPEKPTYGVGRGGQEAAGVEWFTQDQMPDLGDFGYNHGLTYNRMFEAAEQLGGRIA